MQDVGIQIAALDNTLHVGFAEIINELHFIQNILVETLSHPVMVEAQDLYQIGVRLLRRGLLEDAKRKLLEARDRDPSAFAVYVALGATYVELGKANKALRNFMLAERNSETIAQEGYALLLQGRLELASGNTSAARERFRSATRTDARRAVFWYALAQCEAKSGKADACKTALDRAISLDRRCYSEALMDPFFEGVREEVRGYCRGLAREKYRIASAKIKWFNDALGELGKSNLRWFVPDSFGAIKSKAAEMVSQLHPEKFFVSLDVIAEAAKLYDECRALQRQAKERRESHEKWIKNRISDARASRFGCFGCGYAIVLLSLVVSAVSGTFKEDLPINVILVLVALLVSIIPLLYDFVRAHRWNSKAFIEQWFRK